MKTKFTIVALMLISATACTHQHSAPTFSWYHPMGGEYLFTYDAGECESKVKEQGFSLGTDTHGPFFQCMHQRGYYLVDANGIVQAPSMQSLDEGPQVTLQ